MLQPGGVSEMFYGTDREQILLNKRKGFCKMCLTTGASIVPCYCFGANEVYTRHFGPDSILAKLSSVLRVSLVPWSGRWGLPFGVVPNPCKLCVVLGKPIDVEMVAEPTREQVEALHSRYVATLRELFDRHKEHMGTDWVSRRGTLSLEDEKVKSA
jgi:1-acyl-sn-glycerol-3-phosphate acyltransferase